MVKSQDDSDSTEKYVMNLLPDQLLVESSVVANCRMNRERVLTGTNGYTHDLKFNPLDFLSEKIHKQGSAAWLDLCCGTANALVEASRAAESEEIDSELSIVGVDLVGMFNPEARDRKNLQLVEASLDSWKPSRSFDLITCVHGLHYIGDKLGLISRAVSWLSVEGLFVTHLDLNNIRIEGLKSSRRLILSEFRRQALEYDSRQRILSCRGKHQIEFGLNYLGGDDEAGPNFTGQPAVDSYYRRPGLES